MAIEYAKGGFRFIAVGLLVVWFALFSGLWFAVLKQAKRFQVVITAGYFLFMHYCVLFPFFMSFQGFPFVLPLTPLMHVNMLLLLPYLGSGLLLLCLIAFQYYAAQKDKRAVLFVFPFLFSFFMNKPKKQPWQQSFIACGKKWEQKRPYERAQEICQHLLTIRESNPNKKIFILPETTFPFVLIEHRYALQMWTDNVLYNDAYLILGAYRKNNNKLFNSFYLVHKSRIIFCYDKTHLIPFFEKQHSFNKLFKKGNALFLHKKESFTSGLSRGKKLIFKNTPPLTPLMCSEAFWCMPKKVKVITLVNDNYFSLKYFRKNMKLLFDFNALEQSSDGIYCSYKM